MSVLSEQHRALLRTRDFLYALLDPKATPRVPRSVRQRARDCLRHYPMLCGDGKPMFSKA
jgi:hypothetical protein